MVDEVLDTDDDGFYNYVLSLNFCRAFEGFSGDCFEMTCGEGESCSPTKLRTSSDQRTWRDDPPPWRRPSRALPRRRSAGPLGMRGDRGVAGTNPCESFCLGADGTVSQVSPPTSREPHGLPNDR